MIIDLAADVIAKRYAQAFLNIYGSQYTLDNMQAIALWNDFFRENQQMTYSLALPFISQEKKKEGLVLLQKKFNIPSTFTSLIDLLFQAKRIHLLPIVSQKILELYKKRNNVMTCVITSSHASRKEDIETIVQFISKKTRATIQYTYAQDKSLIAGIRVRSATISWEYSIKKQLQKLQALSID
jgi:F-type H+-transporting ATPase subunit delta